MGRDSADVAMLGLTEAVAGRQFTDPVHTRRDADMMRALLCRERELVHALDRGSQTGPYVIEGEENGRRHWLVIPDVAALARAKDVTAVGFFGQARGDV